jgi:hypothetical protein
MTGIEIHEGKHVTELMVDTRGWKHVPKDTLNDEGNNTMATNHNGGLRGRIGVQKGPTRKRI